MKYVYPISDLCYIDLNIDANKFTNNNADITSKDQLGSIVALTNENGDVVLEQSFDACSVTLKFDDDNQSNFLVEPIPSSEQANREERYRNPENWTYNNVLESPKQWFWKKILQNKQRTYRIHKINKTIVVILH